MTVKPLKIQKNHNLKTYNTLGVDAYTSWFASVTSEDQLISILGDPDFDEIPKFILGGGSNILFAGDFPGLIIQIDIPGKEIIEEYDDDIFIRVGAGENWHNLVVHCVNRGWGGIENLSLIPGRTGAAPIQNIGAYGVELKDVFYSLNAIEMTTGSSESFTNEDCHFGYRDSIFKNKYKNQYIITDITLRLSKNPVLNTSYGAIESRLKDRNIKNPTIKDVSELVIEIRNEKLPDPSDLGNAGSFFKNPIVDKTEFESLKKQYPDMPGYKVSGENMKVPAGWLIEKAGWKGKIVGRAGTYRQQALVIVNHGGATGEEILELAEEIKSDVASKFGIKLVPEVHIIGETDSR